MNPLDDYPINDAAVSRDGRIADAPRRWFQRLVATVRKSVTVLGVVTRRVVTGTGDVWLQSNVTLPAGLYRLSGSLLTVAGGSGSTVTLLADDGGTGVTTASADGLLLVRLTAGSRVGYRVTPASGAEVDAQIVVEALPDANVLG